MANRRSGWKGESRRHSLARKGIRTANGKLDENVRLHPITRYSDSHMMKKYGKPEEIQRIILKKLKKEDYDTVYYGNGYEEYYMKLKLIKPDIDDEALPNEPAYDPIAIKRVGDALDIDTKGKSFAEILNSDEYWDSINKHQDWLNRNVKMSSGSFIIYCVDHEDPYSEWWLMYTWDSNDVKPIKASGKVADDINRIFKRTEEHGSRTAKRINKGLQKVDESATETARDFNKAIKKVG